MGSEFLRSHERSAPSTSTSQILDLNGMDVELIEASDPDLAEPEAITNTDHDDDNDDDPHHNENHRRSHYSNDNLINDTATANPNDTSDQFKSFGFSMTTSYANSPGNLLGSAATS